VKYQTLPDVWLASGHAARTSIDPGSKSCAVACSDRNDQLIWVGAVEPPELRPRGPGCECVIIERPEANGRATPPDDLIAITAAGFFLAGLIAGGPVRSVTPREWKGQVPKPAHHRRLWEALSAAERELLGGAATLAAITAACQRGAKDRWRKPGATYYRASELPTVRRTTKITHDILDTSALNLYDSGRLPGP
jgi:hypothetical protein